MKIKYLSTLLFGLFASLTVSAQQQKEFTLEDLNFGGKNFHNMVPKNRYCTWWGDQLVRQDASECYLVDKSTGKETKLFSVNEINQWISNTKDIKVRSLYNAQFPNADRPEVVLGNGSKIYVVDFKKHSLVSSHEIGEDDNVLEMNYKSGAMAVLRDSNLFMRLGTKEWQLSKDGSREIVYGQSVHRDEFGIHKGTYFSNSGTKLAFYRMDQSMVTDYPQVDIPEIDYFKHPETQTCCAKAAPDKYPMTGETSHKVTVGVFDTKTGNTVYLKAGDPTDRYFTNIAWSPDDKTIYMFELNRDQNDCRLVSYDATTGEKTGELYRETDEKYVEPQHPIMFLPWDNTKFLMQSQKDGYNHLYLYDLKKKAIRQVTKGNFVIESLLGFNKKTKAAVVLANADSPIQRNIYTVDLKNGKMRRIDNGEGMHQAQLSESGAFVADKYSAPDTPRNIDLINTATGKSTRLLTAENPWKGYNIPEYSCGTLKAADGETDLYYRMVKPIGFDPQKKYPTVIYVYGGPHAHNVDASWHYGSRSWETYMAQKGYLLFILDNRGSERRGRDFEQATFRQLGQVEMADQMKGVDFLKSLPYVDKDRIGVHGWSFGGYMTTTLMCNHPEVFKVGVAGGPVIDWKWYEVMYGERYMDTPETNPEGYEKTSLLNMAKNLKGKLQIIIGMNDPTVVPQHALQFLNACVEAGTQPDFFVYPGEGHNMMGHASVHLHERITQYFEDYLK